MTDPKNTDYEMESGGTRNYEVWHDERRTNEEAERRLEEEEKLDSMKALENRVLESQREVAELDALEEIRAMNQRHLGLMSRGGKKMDGAEAVLRAREAAIGGVYDAVELNENGLTKDEEDLVSSIKFGSSGRNNVANYDDAGGGYGIRRLNEEDELLAEKLRMEEAEEAIAKQRENASNERKRSNLPIFKAKKRRKDSPIITEIKADASIRPAENSRTKSLNDDENPCIDAGICSTGALGGLLAYGSDSD